jgi:ParB/RepB/Spo0J family partition protein
MTTEFQLDIFGTDEPVTEKSEKKTEPKCKYQHGKLYEVECSAIVSNPSQPRTHFSDEKIEALAESIKNHGILQPIVCIVASDGTLLLAAGERRLRAAISAGLRKVPVWIADGDLIKISLVENMLREDLTAVEEAEAIYSLKADKNCRLEDLSALLGKAVSTISEMMAVGSLPLEILDDCRCDPGMPRDILVLISRLPTDEKKISYYREFRAGKLTRKDLKPGGATLKTRQVSEFITSFAKSFNGLNWDLAEEDREKVVSELERLYARIGETLDKLKG